MQMLVATCLKAEAVVDKYNRVLSGSKRQKSRRSAEKERYVPPKRKSVRDQLRRLRVEGGQQKPKHQFHETEINSFYAETTSQGSIPALQDMHCGKRTLCKILKSCRVFLKFCRLVPKEIFV